MRLTLKSVSSLLFSLTCSLVNLQSAVVANVTEIATVSSERVTPVPEKIVYYLARPRFQNPKPDCVILEPGPGNPCFCFYNGRVFRCLNRQGLPGNNCSYHKDCGSPNDDDDTTPLPALGLSVPTWHQLTL